MPHIAAILVRFINGIEQACDKDQSRQLDSGLAHASRIDSIKRRSQYLVEVEIHKRSLRKPLVVGYLCCKRLCSACRNAVLLLAPIFTSTLEFANDTPLTRMRSATAACV